MYAVLAMGVSAGTGPLRLGARRPWNLVSLAFLPLGGPQFHRLADVQYLASAREPANQTWFRASPSFSRPRASAHAQVHQRYWSSCVAGGCVPSLGIDDASRGTRGGCRYEIYESSAVEYDGSDAWKAIEVAVPQGVRGLWSWTVISTHRTACCSHHYCSSRLPRFFPSWLVLTGTGVNRRTRAISGVIQQTVGGCAAYSVNAYLKLAPKV